MSADEETLESVRNQRMALSDRLRTVEGQLNEAKLDAAKWEWAWRELAKLRMWPHDKPR